MIYWVRHRTTYKYESQVGYARCVLRLTPALNRVQTLLEHHIAITPTPAASLLRQGPFGEATRTVEVTTAHRQLMVEATSSVDVHAQTPPPPASSAPWESVRAEAFQSASLGPEAPAPFLYPTARLPLSATLTDYARPVFSASRPVIEAATELMTAIHRDFVYDPDATTVSTPVAQAFEARRGVCQDFAHIMISGLRGLGLPAAYVSGYLRTTPPPGRPRLRGADATHAWVSLWCGSALGWVGFDPTNAVLVHDNHIVLATGRDYSDVAPISGISLAPGEQRLEVEVDVVPEDELDAGAVSTSARRSLVRGPSPA